MGDAPHVRALVVVTAATIGVAYLLWQLTDLLLLVFGAILVAVVLRAIADPIRNFARLSDGLALVVAGLFLVLVGESSASSWVASYAGSSKILQRGFLS